MPSFFATPRFRVLDLPAEIREAIFAYALLSDKPLVTFRIDDYQKDSYQEAVQPALTRVNRLLRQETLAIFYEINCFILHTAEPKMTDTCRWLRCTERLFPSICCFSLWLRYVELTNDRNATNGAICVSIERAKVKGVWRVVDDWTWVTVTRKPVELRMDARYLINELRSIIQEEPQAMTSAAHIAGMMTDLRMQYVKEKMA